MKMNKNPSMMSPIKQILELHKTTLNHLISNIEEMNDRLHFMSLQDSIDLLQEGTQGLDNVIKSLEKYIENE
jgi:hypothetical protein